MRGAGGGKKMKNAPPVAKNQPEQKWKGKKEVLNNALAYLFWMETAAMGLIKQKHFDVRSEINFAAKIVIG